MKIVLVICIVIFPWTVNAAGICGTSKDDCHRLATCTDTTPGEYVCECNKGYHGDGKSMCAGIKICGTDKDDCHEMATCVDSAPGAFTCTCNEGYTGDGKTCTVSPSDPEQCQKMDIIFVLDRSGSIKTGDYKKMRDFLEIVGKRLRIGERNEKGEILGQAAIVTFSEKGTLRVSLKESQTPGVFSQKVKSMPGPEPGGRTKTHKGLKIAESMTTREAGFRLDDPDVNRIFMVITDGKQTTSFKKDFVPVNKAMEFFHNLNMDVFVVGVGLTQQVAIDEVQSMVSKPENAILAKNYAELSETVEQYVHKFCPVPTICGSKLDDCSKDLASCQDTGEGLYDCTCKDGYLGNGKTCTAPYICGSEKDECHPVHGICGETGLPGGYTCRCKEGYEGDGKVCKATDACSSGTHDCHALATCISGDGDYQCVCNEGYTGDGRSCTEINACTAGLSDCHEFATCTSTGPGTFKCDCNQGYTGDGKMCTEINACTAGLADCHEFATCTSTGPGTFRCDCNEGYTGDGKTCTGIDACAAGLDDCHEFATCTSITSGKFKCDCNQGYTGDGKMCTEIDACAAGLDDCHEFATCTSTGPGTFKCDCNQGYTGDGKMCTEINACTAGLDDCHEFATCTSTGPGTFKCDCNQGYTGDGKMCTEINACTAGLDDCHKYATCTPTGPGTFKCDCNEGYTGDGKTCKEIDNCANGQNDCHKFATCTHIGRGSFTCNCFRGYTGDGRTCTEIDACASGQHDCHEFATCTPTGPGTFKCDCIEHYTGNGRFCVAMKICGTERDNCHKFAKCENTAPGKHTCTCNNGYVGDGKTCSVPKICGTEKDECHRFATCTDTGPGEHTCTCISGYSGDGKQCSLNKICGSKKDKCSAYGICEDTSPGKYRCTCKEGFTGDGKKCRAKRICGVSDDCHKFATCVDTAPGEYVCTCNEGFTGDGKDCEVLPPDPEQCKETDVIFVLDRSGSIKRSDYEQMRSFVQEVGKRLQIGEKNDKGVVIGQGAVFTFSEAGEKVITLDESREPGAFAKAVREMPSGLPGGRTKTHLGLQRALEYTTVEHGLRENVGTILMVITDGQQTRSRNYVYVGEAMQPFFSLNVNVFAIGVGLTKQTQIDEIKDMVQDQKNAILAKNYKELSEEVEKYMSKICPVPAVCGSQKDDCFPSLSTCNDLPDGKYDCVCQDGYRGNGKFCAAPYTCGTAADKCHRRAICKETKIPGQVQCDCKPGFAGDGQKCKPIKVCQTDKHDCSQYAECVDGSLPGQYTCTCKAGYVGDGKSCEVASVCGTDKERCHKFATCTDSENGGHTCECNDGYTGDGEKCNAVQVCGSDADDCSQFGTCYDIGAGMHRCACNVGYEGDGKTCTAMKLCGTDKDNCHKTLATCADTKPGEITCTCNEGYTGDGVTCRGVFIAFTRPVYKVAEGKPGVVEVEVQSGDITVDTTVRVSTKEMTADKTDFVETIHEVTFAAGETGPKPVSIDTVDDTNYEDDERFMVSLSTDAAYVMLGEPSSVVITNDDALDMCKGGTHDCSEFATCTFTGSKTYDCNCNPGYKGDGRSCVAIDKCADGTHDCNKFATCTFTGPGTFSCDCNPGYSGDGRVCDGVVIGFTRPNYETTEGKPGVVEVVVNKGEITIPTTVRVSTTEKTADKTDFNGIMLHEVTFAAGETGPKTVTIDTVDDSDYEDDETFEVSLSTDAAYVTLGEPSFVKIINDDAQNLCTTGKYDCSEFATCVFTGSGTYDCKCNEGYSGDGKSCKAINKCEDGTHDCHEFATCAFTGPGTYDCACNQGYIGDGKLCEEIKVCGTEKDNCHKTLGICTDTGPGVFSCSCIDGYSGDGIVCVGVAIGFTRPVYDTTEGQPGIVEVEVVSGEIVKPTTVVVTTAEKVADKDDFEQTTQEVTFAVGETGPKPVTINTIDDSDYEDDEEFLVSLSTDASYVTLGKPSSVNIINDDALNLCEGVKHDCSEFATCVFTGSGTYDCKCNEGYTGNGKTCEEIKVCGTEKDNCHKTLGICSNTGPGQFTCACKKGYKGDGITCEGVVFGFTAPNYNTKEGQPAEVEIVVVSGEVPEPVIVELTTKEMTADKNDFDSDTVERVIFSPGETGPKTVTIKTVDDSDYEDDERFVVSLSTDVPFASVGEPSYVTIVNDDALNLCEGVKHDCSEFATCLFTGSGTYDCNCNEGYAGNGKTCEEIKVCGTEKDNCHKTLGICSNTGPGQFTCACKKGYKGDGITCEGVVFGFDAPNYITKEGQPAELVIVLVSGEVLEPVTVDVITKEETADKNDFDSDNIRGVVFNPGETGPKKVTIDTKDDSDYEDDERLMVSLATDVPFASVGVPSYVTIVNDDALNLCEGMKHDCSEFATCLFTGSGTYDCNCNEGYAGNGKTCEEIKVCGTEKDNCHKTLGICSNTGPGQFTCACKKGYKGDGITCEGVVFGFDAPNYITKEGQPAELVIVVVSGEVLEPVSVDVITKEETADKNDFDSDNIRGVVFNPGETGPKKVTIDTKDDSDYEDDERLMVSLATDVPFASVGAPSYVTIVNDDALNLCEGMKHDCSEFATCLFTGSGTYDCNCNEGYAGNGKTCEEIKVCGTEKDNCHKTLGICSNTGPGQFTCSCKKGYKGDGITCEGVVFGFDAPNYITKEGQPAELVIVLVSGEVLEPVTVDVITKEETADKNDFDSDNIRGVVFNPGETGPKKVTIDTKDDSDYEDDERLMVSLATDVPFASVGAPSYVTIVNDDALNLCEGMKHDCSEFATCLFTGSGTYDCNCNEGYAGNGKTCEEIKVCGTEKDNCHKTLGICSNTGPGQFTCACKKGYKGDGITCEGVVFGFDAPNYITKEGQPAELVIVLVSGEVLEPVTVDVITKEETADKNDFDSDNIRGVVFNPGETGPKKVTIDTKDDSDYEDDERLMVSLATDVPFASVGAPSYVTIVNDDALNLCEGMKHDCSEFATCLFTGSGTYDCNCNEGYAGNGKTCEEIKVCGTEKDNCHKTLGICSNTGPGQFTCACKKGYKGDGITCEGVVFGFDAPNYITKEGQPAELVIVVVSGEVLEPVSVDVITKEETADKNDFDSDNIRGVVFNPGETGPKKVTIDTKDDSDYEDDERLMVSLATDVPFASVGAPSYVTIVNDDARNICKEGIHDCSQYGTCIFTGSGKYDCRCNDGYTGDGKTCEAINKCTDGTHDCSKFATCTFTGPGTFDCSCNQGYVGDGKICEAIKLCGTGKENCHKTLATCTDSAPGEFTCACKKGYSGDGIECKGVLIGFTNPVYSVDEGRPATVEVSVVSGDITTPTTVRVSTKEKTADKDDFVETIEEVTFAVGETAPKPVTIKTVDDNDFEAVERFQVSLSTDADHVTLGKPSHVEIIDNDEETPPELVDLFPVDGSIVSAAWKPPRSSLSEILSYAVCYKEVGGQEDICDNYKTTPDGEKLKFSLKDLKAGTTYAVSVKAKTKDGYGPSSNTMTVTTPTEETVCDKKTDAIFVIDRSAGIRPSDYDKVRNFVMAVGRKLRVGVKDKNGEVIGQAAVVLYSDVGENVLSLSQSSVTGNFENAVKKMPGPLPKGRTRTHRGLKTALDQVEKTGSGLRRNREDVNKVVIVISNGAQTRGSGSLPNIAETVVPFFESGVEVVAVGIDLRTPRARKELYDMASVPDNAIVIDEFDDLKSNVDKVFGRICPQPQRCGIKDVLCHKFATCKKTYYDTKECVCKAGYSGDGETCIENKCNFDIGFLIDSSASLRDCNYDKEKDLVNKIAENFGVGQGKSQASVILYSSNAVLKKSFSDIQSLGGFQELIKNLPLQGGGTQYNEALELAITKMFTKENGMRGEEVPKLLFLLTDGYLPTRAGCRSLTEIAKTLGEKGITVVAIGAGEAERKQLGEVVDTPSNLIMVRNFEDALSKVEELPKKFCPGDSCKIAERITTINYKQCSSEKPVTIRYCQGDCADGTFLRMHSARLGTPCRICKPIAQKKKSVVLVCPGDKRTKYTYKEATACECQICPWKRL